MSGSEQLLDLDEARNPPTDPEANGVYRTGLYNSSLGRPEVQADFLRLCSVDMLWCFNSCFWTLDPRAT